LDSVNLSLLLPLSLPSLSPPHTQVQRLSVGSIPRALLVVLEDDLVDSCKSGKNLNIKLTVCGVLLGDEVTVYGVLPGDEVTVYGVLLGDEVTVYGVLLGD